MNAVWKRLTLTEDQRRAAKWQAHSDRAHQYERDLEAIFTLRDQGGITEEESRCRVNELDDPCDDDIDYELDFNAYKREHNKNIRPGSGVRQMN